MGKEEVGGGVYIHIMEYYSAIKRDEIMRLAATWMDIEITKSSKSKTNFMHNHLYVESTE